MVVRVFNTADASAVVDFINNNFADKVIQTNPFLIKEGKVGMAADHRLSFNSELAGQIAKYVKREKYEDISLNGFQRYLENFREAVLRDPELLDHLLEERIRKGYRMTNSKYLYNVLDVIDLMIISLDESMGIEEIKKYWEGLHDVIQSEKREDEIAKAIAKRNRYIVEKYVEKPAMIGATEIGKSVLTGENAIDGVQMQATQEIIDRDMTNEQKKEKTEEGVDGK